MSRLTGLLRNVVSRTRLERDLDEELRAYVDLIAEEKRNAGLSAEQARRAALIQLGGLEQVKERVRDARSGSAVDQLRQDLSYGLRILRRNRGFTAIAVATIALGIGAGTAVFSIVDTVVFRQLPYADPDRLVRLCGTGPRDRSCDDDFSRAELVSIREQNDVFEQVAADDGFGGTITRADGSREPAGVGLVSTNWLATLGVRPQAGRDFRPEEGEAGSDRVLILTDDFWRRRFDRDRNVLGATLVLDGQIHTIVGVLPPNVLRNYADLLKPLVSSHYSETSLDLTARLKPGVTTARAAAAVAVIASRIDQGASSGAPARRFDVEPLGKDNAGVDSKTFPGLLVMLAAVGLVLLIACANVANLLLARASVRRRECLVRSALGASRGRLLRQFLVESVLLFAIGGTLGVLVARVSLGSLAAFAVSGGYLPQRMAVTVDLRVISVSLLVSVLTGLCFGIIPALQASAVNPIAARAPRRGRMTRRLIVIELAMSVVLIAGFGLLFRSFERLYAISAGFNPERVLITGSDGGRSFSQAIEFWRAALARGREIPGVVSVAVTSRPPLHGARRQHFAIEGQPPVGPAAAEAGDILVSEEYFQTIGIAIVKGRAFNRTDNERSRPVAVISETLARRYFPDRDPIGSRISVLEHAPMTCCSAPGPVDGVWREIVGVVADVRQTNLDEPPDATLYRPYSQIVEHDMFLVVRTGSAAQPGRVAGELQSRLDALDPAREWWTVRPMSQVVHESESIRLRRFVLILLGGFATVALFLAAIGIYGVASGAVAERTHEIGVRIALGATSPAIFRELVGEMMALAAAGLALGCAGTLTLIRLIRAMLFGIGAADPATYGGVTLMLAAVVFAATCLPARRATRVDPLTALRHD